MTASQNPPGPRKSRRLAPDELARELANRLKSAGGPDSDRKRFLPRFDLLNAGRLIMGFAALLVGVGLVVGFSWLSGMAGYETTGTVSETTPAYACPGEPELGKVFEGEAITLIGLSPDQIWLAVRDNRGPGNAVYVQRSLVAVDGDVSLLSTRECQPSDAQRIAAGQTSAAPGEGPSTSLGVVTTADNTLNGVTASTEGSGLPVASGTIPRAPTTTTQPYSVTTTTRPNSVTTQPGTTTSPTSSTSTSTSSSSSTSSTTSSTTTTTVDTTTTTTADTTTTTEETTTTTVPETTTTTTIP